MTATAGTWMSFFAAAGIPSAASATYAHVFVQNRMRLDMLLDLTKDYLREMGITPMGDIIAILRHAKLVYDQSTREKILSNEQKVPVAAISASSSKVVLPKSENKVKLPSTQVSALPKPARRVLPEHEGRYKITLPSGTTPRSKEILAKKAKLYADKDDTRNVFDRLKVSKPVSIDEQTNQVFRITGVNKPSSSIFSRLGQKESEELERRATQGILKNSPKKTVRPMLNQPQTEQRVILVKKIPAKASRMVEDDYRMYEKMETNEKAVSFSEEDEVLEIESRKKSSEQTMKMSSIKARLGNIEKTPLNKTKKVVRLKQTLNRTSVSPIIAKMKSDEILNSKNVSVRNRLALAGSSTKKSSSVSKLASRMGRVVLQPKKPRSTSSSVFDRLGFGK